MTIESYRYRAQARWGQVLVAESDACLSLERGGSQAVLCFPVGDIDLGLFRQEGPAHPSPEEGEVGLWSLDGPPGEAGPPNKETWISPSSSRTDGREVLRTFVEPLAPLAQLAGYGAFDQDRVRVEVVDERPGDDPRDVTLKRFPPWGDAAHLIDILDVRPEGDLSFVSVTRDDGLRPVVEGSQMLGQSIVAAGRHAPDRRVVSAGMVFMRPADTRRPLRFELSELSAGRTFSSLSVAVSQDGRNCAAGTFLLGAPSPDVVHHGVEPPAVPGPYECPPFDMGVTGRDLRVVDAAYTNTAHAPAGPPTIDAWVRFREVPDDPPLHAGLLAQFTGHMSIATALRPHEGVGQDQAHRTLSMGINAIHISLHRDMRADQWMLYHHLSTFAGDGMTHSECRVHDEGGQLLASFTVEAMVRGVPGGGTLDDRTGL
jgi:acyl-CoA thioesterase/uncharacterized protein (DUF427 family)